MSLSVQISNTISGVTTTYAIKSDSVDHSFTRFTTQAPLPSGTPNVAGTNFWLDLGMELEQITLSGTVDTVGSNSGGVVYPSKVNLEDVCRNWWNYTNATVVVSTLPQLTLSSGQTYAVAIKQADFKQEAGEEDRWTFSIVFIVGAKI
jgi:hypothetical protein